MPQLQTTAERSTTIVSLIQKQTKAFALGLPAFMRDQADRFARVAITTVKRNPGLLNCTQDTFFGALQEACQLGLMCDGVLGHAYLVPYRNNRTGTSTCQLIIGYKGLIALAYRSGQIKSLRTEIVYEKDSFERQGRNHVVKHIAYEDGDPGAIKYAYAVVETSLGGSVTWCCDRAQIDRIKKSSAGAGKPDSPWNTHPETMWAKSALRRALKLAPASTDLQRAISLDERADDGLDQEIVDVEFSVVPDADGEAGDAVSAAEDNAERVKYLSSIRAVLATKKVAKLEDKIADAWNSGSALEDLSLEQLKSFLPAVTKTSGDDLAAIADSGDWPS